MCIFYNHVVQFLISYFCSFAPLSLCASSPRQIVKQQLNWPQFSGQLSASKFREIHFLGPWLACWALLSSWFFVHKSLSPISFTFVALLWWSLDLPFRINHIATPWSIPYGTVSIKILTLLFLLASHIVSTFPYLRSLFYECFWLLCFLHSCPASLLF